MKNNSKIFKLYIYTYVSHEFRYTVFTVCYVYFTKGIDEVIISFLD